jgi:hypothetical protein
VFAGRRLRAQSAPRENRTITSAMRLRMDLVEGCICFNIVSLANVGCGYGMRAWRVARAECSEMGLGSFGRFVRRGMMRARRERRVSDFDRAKAN